ncbi:MAG TPA: hypothetical protein VKQ73_13780, partial [Stellaceae bacterium]|nr:hypothetical protein [Stellaceae bacterium]
LRQIAGQYPEAEPALLDLFGSCGVAKRENTGHGFFTDLMPDRTKHSPLSLRSPLGDAFANVEGMVYPLGLLVFLKEGYPVLLEGYAAGGDDTFPIDFSKVTFTVGDFP